MVELTYSELSQFVRNKEQLHIALGRANYRLPSVNSGVCDLRVLMQIRDGTIWCPKASDVT